MKKSLLLLLLIAGTLCFSSAQNSLGNLNQAPNAQEKFVVNYTGKTLKKSISNNKSTLIWGAGSTNGAAIGEFSTAFNTAGSWTATSLNDGNATPGNAFWTRSTLGYSQGAYWSGTTPIASPSNANGVAIFDSDFMDNGGVAGAFGTGSSPSPHAGELVSPAIDLTGYTDSALSIDFYGYYRNFSITELSVGLSVDGGVSYTTTSIINLLPNLTEGNVTAVFPNATAGVTNLTNCRIKFTFDGDYYFAIVDDVSISTAEPFDLTIQKADPAGVTLASANEVFQIGNNVSSLINQINPSDLRYGANVKNLGFENVTTTDNATLGLTVQQDIGGSWSTVFQTTTNIDTISATSNGSAIYDTIANQNWLAVGDYRAIYYTNITGDANPSNDTLIQTFSITSDYLSKVERNIFGNPVFNRPIFPGGTNFNKFEFGSYFSSPNGGSEFLTFDSATYIYYIPIGYNGSGTQIISANIYEWQDGGGTGVLNGIPDPLANGEHTLVAVGLDTLSGLSAASGGTYNLSSMRFVDANNGNLGYNLQDGKTYLISLSADGTQFTSSSSVWFGASENRSYSMNFSTSGTILSPSQLFLEDGTGAASGNYLGFGADLVASFGVHTSSTPPPVANLVISEIMYNPPESGTDSLEYIEIYNADTSAVDLNGYSFTQGVNHTFGSLTLAPSDFLVIAVDSTAFRNVFGFAADDQWSSGGLSNGGEDITLHDNLGRFIDSVDYDDGGTWPSGSAAGRPDGGGSSIELIALNADNNLGINWMASNEGSGTIVNGDEVLGSPGYFPLELTLNSTDVSCNGNADGNAKALVSRGLQPISYLWSTGATVDSISSLSSGTYFITVTDGNGTSLIDSVSINEPSNLISSIAIDSNVSCNGGTDGGITASASGGTMPYSYLWSNGATTASITGLAASTFTVTITDGNSCSSTSTANVTEPTALVAAIAIDSNVSCNGATDGGATASASGGTMPYTYLWSNGTTTASITGLAANTYSVTITDGNSCSATSTANVTEPTALVAAIAIDSNVSCNGATDGGATASASGGTMPYAYLWSNGATTASITGIAASTYSVTITDGNSCSATNTATITEPTLLTVSTVVDSNATCNGAADGGVSASANGGTMPYTYLWSNGATTASITGIAASTYSVTITDGNGCSATSSSTITEPSPLTSSVTIVDASCNGAADGSISLTVNGGTTPYNYSWNSGLGTTPTLNNLAAGSYAVTITDANGCSLTNSYTINQLTAIVTTVTQAGTSLTADQVGATYQWLDCNNNSSPIAVAISQTYVATANGDYAVEISLRGCVDTSACINVISVGLDGPEENAIEFKVYPNPTNGDLNIAIQGNSFKQERLRIFDMSGKIVRDVLVNGNFLEIDLHGLNSGVYFLDLAGAKRKIILND